MSSTPPAREPPAQESESGAAPVAGWCAREVEEELPGLRLLSVEAALARRGSPTGASPVDIRGRLQELSNRLRGAAAIAVRDGALSGERLNSQMTAQVSRSSGVELICYRSASHISPPGSVSAD